MPVKFSVFFSVFETFQNKKLKCKQEAIVLISILLAASKKIRKRPKDRFSICVFLFVLLLSHQGLTCLQLVVGQIWPIFIWPMS